MTMGISRTREKRYGTDEFSAMAIGPLESDEFLRTSLGVYCAEFLQVFELISVQRN